VATEHADVIHDVAYDYYGERMATCSSDMHIKIWERGQCAAAWKAHDGSIWGVAWAHPEFGQVLASCSFDKGVHIWEEPSGGARGGPWNRKATLGEAHNSVAGVAFAPKSLGARPTGRSTSHIRARPRAHARSCTRAVARGESTCSCVSLSCVFLPRPLQRPREARMGRLVPAWQGGGAVGPLCAADSGERGSGRESEGHSSDAATPHLPNPFACRTLPNSNPVQAVCQSCCPP
jgi:hypothetical protein